MPFQHLPCITDNITIQAIHSFWCFLFIFRLQYYFFFFMEIYQQLQQRYTQEVQVWQKKFNLISWLRLVVFLAGVAIVWVTANTIQNPLLTVLISLVFLGFFIAVLYWHTRTGYKRNQFRFLVRINQEEIQRLQGTYHPEQTGQSYNDPHHPYTNDLDIFGHHSLFVLLNRTQTVGGTLKLAHWLKERSLPHQILERQEAITELKNHLNWQQNFQATGRHHTDKTENLQNLSQWMETPPHLYNRKGMVVVSWLMAFSMGVALILSTFVESVTYHLPLLIGIINIGIIGAVNTYIKKMTEQAHESTQSLRLYADLMEQIETHSFSSTRLIELKNQLILEGEKASAKIEQLAGISGNLMSAHNPFFGLFANALMGWSLFWAIRLERWKARTQTNLPLWLEALAEMEALNSLAGFSHANPAYTFPRLHESSSNGQDSIFFTVTHLGHPLLLANKRVSNNFHLTGKGKTIIITGSNMSGKSTFLRTIGCNLVLAMMGAPVCATQMQISLFQVFTSMRTQDSLEESVSSFYAELKRLKQLIDELPKEQPIFYMLDEILKGTNSQDRHQGAKALIRQLHRHNASGLISTHDIALSEMSEELPDSVENFSFNSEVIDNQLVFDYTLQPGICRSFNASKLMQQIGIEM